MKPPHLQVGYNVSYNKFEVIPALVVSLTFLDRNGWDILAPKEEGYFTFLHLADGSFTEDELTIWLTKRAVPLKI